MCQTLTAITQSHSRPFVDLKTQFPRLFLDMPSMSCTISAAMESCSRPFAGVLWISCAIFECAVDVPDNYSHHTTFPQTICRCAVDVLGCLWMSCRCPGLLLL